MTGNIIKKGHCLCGAISFEYAGDELWRGHCHCESCRRQTASPVTTFMGVANGRWHWTKGNPKYYASSPGVKRYFCGDCGSPVAFEAERCPNEIHFYASLLDSHQNFQPDHHYHWEERVSWLQSVNNPRKSKT